MIRLTADDPLREFLLTADPLNCSAQIVLFEKADPLKETRSRLEVQLTSYSSAALAELLNISDSVPTGGGFSPARDRFRSPMDRGISEMSRLSPPLGGPGAAVSTSGQTGADLGPRLARLLWAEKFRTMLESQLSDVRSLEREPNLVLLASTIPQDSTRAALAKLLRKRWNDGPRALETAGLTDQLIVDPGLLVLMKMNPRKENKSAIRGMSGMPSRGIRPVHAMPGNGRTSDSLSLAQRKEQAEQDWMTVSAKMVTAWCTRLYAVALAREKAAAWGGLATPKLPADLTLGEDARVTAACHLVWPKEAPAEVSELKLGLLDVSYFRVVESNKPKRAIAAYARQMQIRTSDARMLDRAVWLDSSRVLPQSDRRRSVDILISRAGTNGSDTTDFLKDDVEAELDVEILMIEIKDPVSRD